MSALRLFSLAVVVVAVLANGRLLVHKQLETDPAMVFASGKNFTVKFDIYNVGDSSAYDININDVWPATTAEGAEGFVLLEGSMDFQLEELAAGDHKSWEFTMAPFFEGNFAGARAEVTYLPTAEGEAVQARSTEPGRMSVFSAENYLKYFASHTREWTIFYVSAAASVLVPFAAWILIQVQSPGGIPAAGFKSD